MCVCLLLLFCLGVRVSVLLIAKTNVFFKVSGGERVCFSEGGKVWGVFGKSFEGKGRRGKKVSRWSGGRN